MSQEDKAASMEVSTHDGLSLNGKMIYLFPRWVGLKVKMKDFRRYAGECMEDGAEMRDENPCERV
jgi:hypothetical protein